jgi:hypothetical protein
MKIEDMNFEPRKGIVISSIVFSVLVNLVFGTIIGVNLYRQLRSPTADFWGWVGAAAVTFACISLLLYFTTATYRIAYHEAGLVLLGLRGRQFIPWLAVTGARLNRYKGNIELALDAGGRRFPVSVPLSSYKKQATLLAEIRKRLPVAIHDPRNTEALLVDD